MRTDAVPLHRHAFKLAQPGTLSQSATELHPLGHDAAVPGMPDILARTNSTLQRKEKIKRSRGMPTHKLWGLAHAVASASSVHRMVCWLKLGRPTSN